MICVQVGGDGAVYVVDPQPVDVGGCGLVLVGANEIAGSPFALTTEQGAQIGMAIVAVWSVAYVVRALVRVGNVADDAERE